MRGFGITYFQDTVKDRQMKISPPNPLKMCPCPYLLKAHQERRNITPPLLHTQAKTDVSL